MKVKKIPLRTCVVTHEKLEKRNLFRIVKNNEGQVFIDNESGKANGRGAYLKKDKEVIELARKNKALEHHLEIKIEEKIYDELINKL